MQNVRLPFLFGLICLPFLFGCEPTETGPSCDGRLTLQAKLLTDGGCNRTNGSIELSASGGTAPYQFRVADSEYVPQSLWSDLSADVYPLRVKDAIGCEAENEISISTGTGYAEIAPIIQQRCAVSACHDGSNDAANFTRSDVVANYAGGIEARTRSGNMPPDSSDISLSASEISLLKCWVENGAPAP